MCCYVGKATKISLCLVAALLVAGLVLGFGLARRTWGGQQKAQPACGWPHCQTDEPVYGIDPRLPAANAPPNPLTQPAVAAFPGATSSSSSAAPPASKPYFGPPNPFTVGLAPTAHA
jgi:hypothetical protein